MEPTVIEHESSTRRRKVTKFALAGVAVLGVGAALTSAAWSDNVWFGGDADAADFELSGFDPVSRTWVPADFNDAASRIELPATAFDTIGPGVADSYELRVRNDGDITIDLDAPIVNVTGFGGQVSGSPGSYDDTRLSPGEQARVTITLIGTDSMVEGTSGRVSVQIVGNSVSDADLLP
jgi:hypothetical protein